MQTYLQLEIQYIRQKQYNSKGPESQYLGWPPLHFTIDWTLRLLSCHFFKHSSGVALWAPWRTFKAPVWKPAAFLFRPLSEWSHTASIILRSELWRGHSMTDSVCLCLSNCVIVDIFQIQQKKWEQIVCLCEMLLVPKCLKIPFKMFLCQVVWYWLSLVPFYSWMTQSLVSSSLTNKRNDQVQVKKPPVSKEKLWKTFRKPAERLLKSTLKKKVW